MTSMRQTLLRAGLPIGAALGCAIALTAITAAPAHAQEEGKSFARGIFDFIVGRESETPEIKYQERPPLVVPPSRTLPSPEKSGDVVVGDPAWPKDPDIAERKAAKEARRNRDISAEMLRDSNPLPPDEVGPRGNVPHRTTPEPPETGKFGERLTAKELGSKKSLFSNIFSRSESEETVKFTGEKPRTSLIDPPAGYQTPSQSQPYGLRAPKTTAEKSRPGELGMGRESE